MASDWKPLLIVLAFLVFMGAIGGWARQIAWWVGIILALSFVLIAVTNAGKTKGPQ